MISGSVGPRGEGYSPDKLMTEDEAERYHSVQIGTFAETEADVITALTMTHAEEAIGVVRAAKSVGMPVVISFTVETDGKLPSGQTQGIPSPLCRTHPRAGLTPSAMVAAKDFLGLA